MHAWFAAGAACVGVGESLITPDAQTDPDTGALVCRCVEFLDSVRASRAS